MEMYHHNTSYGQKMYGGHFKGLRDFVGAHLSAAGTRNADSFHDGMGFLTQHAALTNEFEMSMQVRKLAGVLARVNYDSSQKCVSLNQTAGLSAQK